MWPINCHAHTSSITTRRRLPTSSMDVSTTHHYFTYSALVQSRRQCTVHGWPTQSSVWRAGSSKSPGSDIHMAFAVASWTSCHALPSSLTMEASEALSVRPNFANDGRRDSFYSSPSIPCRWAFYAYLFFQALEGEGLRSFHSTRDFIISLFFFCAVLAWSRHEVSL